MRLNFATSARANGSLATKPCHRPAGHLARVRSAPSPPPTPTVAAEPVCTIEVSTPTGSAPQLSVESGENLRRALLDGKLELYHGMWAKAMNCGGAGSCGTCTVEILDDGSILSERTSNEERKLKGKPASWRLACQTLVGSGENAGNCKVKVGPK